MKNNTIALPYAQSVQPGKQAQMKKSGKIKRQEIECTAPIPQARKLLKKISATATKIMFGVFMLQACVIALAMSYIEMGYMTEGGLVGTIGSILAIVSIVALQYIKIACFNVECELHDIRGQMRK